MYDIRPNLQIGFHGCDVSVRGQLVLNPQSVKFSTNPYDWLGNGFYIWENNQERALKWAEDKQRKGEIKNSSVVGVVYVLHNCLDFSDSNYTQSSASYFRSLKTKMSEIGKQLPSNKNAKLDEYKDMLLRELDCVVIEYLHKEISEAIKIEIKDKGNSELEYFDSCRGIFTEGGPAFPGAGIQMKNHIQVCIRNPNCIKGFFIPRKEVAFK